MVKRSAPTKPDPDFRPNPNRAVYVQGVINQQLVDRLTPKILEFQHDSRGPITVFIDSSGGMTSTVESLLGILSASDQDFSPPCRIITVATARAASSAADLLSSGDYAIAYPGAAILYHGVRTSLDRPLTVESASYLAESLKLGNDRYAMALANRSNFRFVFIYASLSNEFSEYRNRSKATASVSDMECFVGLIRDRLSPNAKSVLEQAEQRNARYEALLDHIFKLVRRSRSKRASSPKRRADMEYFVLRGIIDFELSTHKDVSWTFRDGGLAELHDNFLLSQEFLQNYESQQLRRMCALWADFFLTKPDLEEIAKQPAKGREQMRVEKLKPIIRPI